ncbi:MAG: site-specific DNA-methyltransferase [Candidatus Methanomethylophilaceae archaeon]|nr:site-specific DNA-methyltransferase [Candidatus Methanomethylophilaceae archaeon]MBR6205206.1 site-specific DNA-methyltransferase [Candidatus Methanomethylophilaceae archaeon]
MPTLSWIGKERIVNHHKEVPFHSLKKIYSFPDEGPSDGGEGRNLVIHGDNLYALKSLLPEYEGKVDLVYIDPPYNTGNEGWVYNDNVNDPRIRKWLGEVVGKEGEDMTRHDKWLCMMYPRLSLLRKMLSPRGSIFISIDDTEYANLKSVCDEIFGSSCFVSNISWQRTYSTRNDSKGIVNEVEHILVYSREPGWTPNKLPRTEEMDSIYKNPDNDNVPWASDNPFAPGAATHQGMVYAIQHPFTGEMIYPSNGRCWTFSQDQMLDYMEEWTSYELKDLDDAVERARICGVDPSDVRSDIKAIVLSKPLNEAAKDAKKILDRGRWPRFYFTKNGKGGIRRKTYLSNVGGKPPTNYWPYSEVGHTDEAKKEILSIFDGKAVFDTPKPTRLIEQILRVATDKDSIVLDSFAGSGTTGHAVLRANKADGGHRRFIMIEMLDYAEDVTAERMKRAIIGYQKEPGIPGSFDYMVLGDPLFDDQGYIADDIDAEVVRRYIWYSETRTQLGINGDGHYLGKCNGCAYYLMFDKDGETRLDEEYAKHLTPSESYVIYADSCTMSKDELVKRGITFKKIPRDIPRI